MSVLEMNLSKDKENRDKEDKEIENSQHFKERAERNRQKALLLKKSKIISHPYIKRYIRIN